MTKITLAKNAFLFLICSITWASQLFAIQVKNVKGVKVLLELQGENVTVGDIIKSANGSATILQIKNDQAVAQISSGSLSINEIVQLANKSTNNSNSSANVPAAKNTEPNATNPKVKKANAQMNSDIYSRTSHIKTAVLGKFMYNKMNTKQRDNTSSPGPNEEIVTMTGINPGVFASLDFPWLNWLTLRGTLGYEMLSIGGTAQYQSCDNKSSTSCKATIHYLSGTALGRFDFTKGQKTWWTAFGGGMKFPISKSSTALREEDISFANTIVFSFGLDYNLTNRQYVPISFEYHYSLNQSETVPEISQFALQAGYGISF